MRLAHASIVVGFGFLMALAAHPARPAAPTDVAPLFLEASIPLGNVRGRIDHLAIDLDRQRLFVAELGNDSVGVVDLKAGKVLQTVAGFDEPQGVGYVSSTNELYVANGGDGSIRRYNAATLAPLGPMPLGSDADNVRVDVAGQTVVVGHSNGALAVIDAARHASTRHITLRAHPESFQLAGDGRMAYVNLPDAHEIAVVDLAAGQVLSSWSTGTLRSNYPMALDPSGKTLWVGFRSPSRLASFDTKNGALVQNVPTCGDTDDLFVDTRRHRVYVICGSGEIDVYDVATDTARPIAHFPTRSGARTGLFVPDLDRLYVAARATLTDPAAILVYRVERSVIFVCEHGAARSVIAAAWFNKLAADKHLAVRAYARAVAPQEQLSDSTIAGLKRDGLGIPADRPSGLTKAEADSATAVVAFYPLPPGMTPARPESTYDVPAPVDGYDRSRDAILVHVKALLDNFEAH